MTKSLIVDCLPKAALEIIDHYQNLRLGNKLVPTPYFINENKTHQKNHRSFKGKGSPQELEKAVLEMAAQKRFDLSKATVPQIHQFMQKHGLGIDCSGFVLWVLNSIHEKKFAKPVWSYLSYNAHPLFVRILSKFHPVENASVKILTSTYNSQPVNLKNIKVGDLIETLHGHHIFIVTEVFYEDGLPTKISYANSTDPFFGDSGVKTGWILVTDLDKSLGSQKWPQLQGAKDEKIKLQIQRYIDSTRLYRLKSYPSN